MNEEAAKILLQQMNMLLEIQNEQAKNQERIIELLESINSKITEEWAKPKVIFSPEYKGGGEVWTGGNS